MSRMYRCKGKASKKYSSHEDVGCKFREYNAQLPISDTRHKISETSA